ncbi:MAG: Uma2 family endonuclease [Oscillatoria sp. PMC 1068.18]|nr:Uma2 family endonuclease [Oscillatoria sp. PMC 1076.18]MEC4990775.1 Uma2 family endonuclease [Oscillatoria sp. PMC 1068.18]
MNNPAITLPSSLKLNLDLTDKQFFQLCRNNRDFRFERTATGELIIMPPTGGITGDRNADLTFQLRAWSRQNNLGKSFDSSTGFQLPNKANRSPDAAWIKLERWSALTLAEKEKFLPLCPDFVVELRSSSDSLKSLQAKMQEYLDNGARLGWLIDPKRKVVEIYRPNSEVEILQSPATVSGADILPGFVLDLQPIFSK